MPPRLAVSADRRWLAQLQHDSVRLVSLVADDDYVFEVPAGFVAQCKIVRIHDHEPRVLLVSDEDLRVYDATRPDWRAWIQGAGNSVAGIADAVFGSHSAEVIVTADYGCKTTFWSLETGRGVEVKDTKSLALRPQSRHVALLTRPSTHDFLTLLAPESHEVISCVELSTVDAQGLDWSLDGRWIAVVDTCSAGHSVQIFTADLCLFAQCSAGALDLGVGIVSWTPDGRLLLGDGNQRVLCLAANTHREKSRHLHATPITASGIQIWQEEMDTRGTRSYAPAAQPASPPAAKSSAEKGIVLLVSQAQGSLFASKSDAMPTTAWIWSLDPPELVAVLIHHSPIKQLQWSGDLLLLHCAISQPSVHLWCRRWSSPKILSLNMAPGKFEACWAHSDAVHRLVLLSQTAYALQDISDAGETINPSDRRIDETLGPELIFDEGHSADFSPIKLDELASHRFGGIDDIVDDTFQHRRADLLQGPANTRS